MQKFCVFLRETFLSGNIQYVNVHFAFYGSITFYSCFPFPFGRVGVGFLSFAHMYAPYAVYKVRLVPNYMLPTGYLCFFPLSFPHFLVRIYEPFCGTKKIQISSGKETQKSSNIVLILPLKIGVILVKKTADLDGNKNHAKGENSEPVGG